MDANFSYLCRAYESLIALRVSPSRYRLQGALAALRDEIAHLSGNDPQHVQETFEAMHAIKTTVRFRSLT